MIDLHCHLLPAVDDGAKTISMAIDMAEEAKKEGISEILLTPHHMDGEYINHKNKVIMLTDNLQKIFNDNNIDILIRPGQEVHLTGDLLKAIDNNDILFADGDSKRYVMLEFPHSGIPEYSSDIIFELKIKGICPIIVHPERNHGIQKNPDKLYELVKQGCLTQLTATSFVGGFGKTIQDFTDDIIESGLGFMFASDAHNLKGRRFLMESAFERLERKFGSDKVKEFKRNAELVWDGKDISRGEIKRINDNRSILRKAKSLFRRKRR